MKYIIVRFGNEVDVGPFGKGTQVTVLKADGTSVSGVVYTNPDVEDIPHTHPATVEVGPPSPMGP